MRTLKNPACTVRVEYPHAVMTLVGPPVQYGPVEVVLDSLAVLNLMQTMGAAVESIAEIAATASTQSRQATPESDSEGGVR